MAFMGRKGEAAQRAAERRKRENDAPRLIATVPSLESLKLEIHERRGAETVTHVRRVVVATAPALFAMNCVQKGCEGGGHDLTSSVMSALRRGETSFEGHSACHGQLGPTPCDSALEFVATASFRA
jgi:hypothetical protein